MVPKRRSVQSSAPEQVPEESAPMAAGFRLDPSAGMEVVRHQGPEMKRQSGDSGHLPTELRVVRRPVAEPVIHVADLESSPVGGDQLAKQVQQTNGVQTSREGNQELAAPQAGARENGENTPADGH